MLHGIDVSSFQSTSYDTDGLSFVFMKATEGRSYVNPRLTAQTKTGRDAGLVVGFYHFLWPGNLTAQADYFLQHTPERAGDILAVDWETTSDGTHASNADKDSFIRKLKQLRPHNKVVLYTNRDFWLNIDRTSYAGDGLWIADYVTAGKPRIKAKWRFHQYASQPHDKDLADFASKAALKEWAGG
ncbi:glycoside hydrolase family 25 protein [Streptomyces griseofuscus]|uniref:glycoside hydrolase family 25 protein n=1 Tax=Streptomyces TaxID=1883 RepID=UPI00081D7FB1|nr:MULTISPECIES: glycoside hydrolase family 25 protein [unclassified Streptomyces]MBJ7003533.1 muramidase [Streptomyces sp. CRPSP2-6A1]MYQ91442.1 muramidase [Streptomyces sp. SID4946]MYR90106.1 muramidase [Streptomyces sp. SID685]SCF67536.1 Glycosyl hydrolases family 25 [Streptomyces sp. DconLS]SCF72951.1 Glycosyl hydrolases family 25 [Streptomyces sp. LamerLS-31b]